MDGMYCCSYARFAVRAGIVAAIVGVVLFAAASLAGAQTIVNNAWSVYVGYVSMMLAAFLILLILPRGISEYLERRKIRAAERNGSQRSE